MVAIISSPAETACSKCQVILEKECLKCSRCSVCMHLRCSDLPDYMLLRYKTSQAGYVCRACVLVEGNEESLKEHQKIIEDIKRKEEEAIKQAVLDDSVTHISVKEDMKDEIDENEKQSRTVKDLKDSSSRENNGNKICRFYLRGTCKHGKKGTNCTYDHPALCFKFTTKGDLNGGCKKGNECKYVHPKLCWSLKTGKICRKNNCHFYHVKGTVIKQEDYEVSQPSPERTSKNNESRTKMANKPSTSHISDSRYVSENKTSGSLEHPDFLELKQQMKILQEQLQMLIGLRMSQMPPTRPMGWGHQLQQQ